MGNVNDTGNRENLIDRIRALLAKTPARGATEAEAASALAMAQRLLLKHNLDMAEIRDIDTDDDPVTEEIIAGSVGAKGWKAALASVIGKNMLVQTIAEADGQGIAFIGRPENVAAVIELYGWTAPQLERIAGKLARFQPKWGRRAYATACRRGMVSTIHDRLRESMKEQASTAVTALVVCHNEENDAFMREHYPNTKHTQISVNARAYADGQMAGRAVSLMPGSRQVETQAALR